MNKDMKPHITQEELKQLFTYNEDGFLIWQKNVARVKVGMRAGMVCEDGYVRMKANGRSYTAHRLIFLFHRGHLPQFLDHIDGDPSNNKIENLRPATASQNMQNRKLAKNNSTGFKGVVKRARNRWEARIKDCDKLITIGGFDSPELAYEAYKTKAVELFGEFARFE